ncbi:hypothetical protein TNCV_2355131 [Trichonephila clavipes]|nr:hypothetical protein TNCV_2355131 [Trichonephila clavipes]
MAELLFLPIGTKPSIRDSKGQLASWSWTLPSDCSQASSQNLITLLQHRRIEHPSLRSCFRPAKVFSGVPFHTELHYPVQEANDNPDICYWVHNKSESVMLKALCLSVSLHSIRLSAHDKNFIRFLNLVQSRPPETMTRRKGLIFDEIVNFLLELSENESDGGEMSCFNLDSDEDIRLNENDCKDSEENAD